ncbi:hypothetical protein [Heyndrickxia acidicola]|uniref:hypothetical protein n=1 Tax=Heyndrickxia acidicola TaxID=209389 RepID=UPI0018DC1BC0|nr:hypothetical protein [Heyndrickxia acidicola]
MEPCIIHAAAFTAGALVGCRVGCVERHKASAFAVRAFALFLHGQFKFFITLFLPVRYRAE